MFYHNERNDWSGSLQIHDVSTLAVTANLAVYDFGATICLLQHNTYYTRYSFARIVSSSAKSFNITLGIDKMCAA